MSRPVIFLLFFISGFCGLVYQVIWTRLAFASFGIITPVLSVVISVFMLGLALGSWAGGKWIEAISKRTRQSALFYYGQAELMIGFSAFAVPALFALGNRLLLGSGEMGTFRYLLCSAVILSLAILPWCFFMGATFPLMIAFMKERGHHVATSFSYLYVPNVLGAMAGTLLTAFVLIELLGFAGTLHVAAVGNFLIAAISLLISIRVRRNDGADQAITAGEQLAADTADNLPAHTPALPSRLIPWILFWTGFSSLAMEVVWTRSFTPVIKTQVYSFALILGTYLGATFFGSSLYRWHARRDSVWPGNLLLLLLCLAVFLPVVVNDVRIVHPHDQASLVASNVAILLSSIVPFCFLLGYLTPHLLDEYSGGSPQLAGRSYALNVFGCILGPLIASYVLLPRVTERYAVILLGIPFVGLYLACRERRAAWKIRGLELAAAGIASIASFISQDFEGFLRATQSRFEARRDYAAAVISYGDGGKQRLLVNGIGMSVLTPITKFMAHLTLGMLNGQPKSALIICFGMGTTFRSVLSWDLDTTAVELVPGVRDAFGFYHSDATNCLTNPKGKIIIDDGRRFLMRSREKFDIILIDPPPPVEAAGTSLLYSTDFYELAKQHLNPGGILQAWIPLNGGPTVEAVARSLGDSFPYIRCFSSIERHGKHFLASMQPIESRTASEIAARLPMKATNDLMEWSSVPDSKTYFETMLSREVPFSRLLNPDPSIRITDDRPFNEYFLLRGAR